MPELDQFPASRRPYVPSQEDDDEIYNVILFRWEYLMLVDELTARIGSPRAGGISIALWCDGDRLPGDSA